MTTALLLVALVVTSLGWVSSRANWMAAEDDVLCLRAALRAAEDRAWATERQAELSAGERAP